MSRTKHHSKRHGEPVYGEGTKNRAYGYEYWSSRLGQPHGSIPNTFTKRRTHKKERKVRIDFDTP